MFIARTASAFALVLFAAAVHCAQGSVWEDKPYGEWSKEDIVKIISESPWAKVVGASDTNGSFSYVTIRLRSALPIRQALVRLKQIDSKYEKMSEKKREEFDRMMEGALVCPACDDNYVVSIGPPISYRELKSGIFALRNIRLESLLGKVYLSNDKGEKREIVHFVDPKSNDGEATLFFPRWNEKGEPLLTADSQALTLIFEIKGSQYSGTALPISTKFDVRPMRLEGSVEF